MQRSIALTIFVCLSLLPAIVRADGLIHQLPKDGGWAEFKITGSGTNAEGKVQVTVEGTQTIRSVGKTVFEKKQCRWIELETHLVFQRPGGNAANYNQTLKLLIPEKSLTKGENPREHVLKAYQVASNGTVQQLDLKGAGKRQIQGLDEIFHEPMKSVTPLKKTTIKLGKKNWTCAGFQGVTASANASFATETRTNREAPFGVVTYTYKKKRMRNGKPAGARSMTWKLADSGADAKSSAPDAK